MWAMKNQVQNESISHSKEWEIEKKETQNQTKLPDSTSLKSNQKKVDWYAWTDLGRIYWIYLVESSWSE